jgi:hypothetical protein
VVVLLGAIFAGSAFFVLVTRTPDDPGDAPDEAVVRDLPPRPVTPSSRAPDEPPPTAPKPPPAPRRRAAASTPAPAADERPASPETATLRIVSDIPGAQVFVNREFVGATPATKEGLQPGTYQLNVSAPGYENYVESLELTPGDREVTVRFRVVRLNASLSVVHKHRFGSCQGTLTASPEGLRYDTSHKEDAFQAPLANLETLDINYLDKNLRLQLRKGRRYDFTDPEGNADRLFVFHRDVARARERLSKGETP